MKTFRVTLTYDRRTTRCATWEVEVEADVPMQARAIARNHALNHWSSACPLSVVAVEITPKLTPERLAQDEAEPMQVMGAAA